MYKLSKSGEDFFITTKGAVQWRAALFYLKKF